MQQREKSAAGTEARRAVPRHAWRPDEPERQNALLRYLAAVSDIAAAPRPAPQSAAAPPAAGPEAAAAARPASGTGLLLVREVMDTAAPSVRGDMSFTEVARALSRAHAGSLPVLDGRGQVMGVVSEADLLARAAVAGTGRSTGALARLRGYGLGEEAGKETAERLMTAPAITVHPATPLAEAAWLACLSRLKRIPVVDHEGQLVGTVDRHALLDALVGEAGPRTEPAAM